MWNKVAEIGIKSLKKNLKAFVHKKHLEKERLFVKRRFVKKKKKENR
jgi:hypothetical protein